MQPWCLFLAAVNVAGTGLLKMEALRAALTAAGFAEVRTVLASGNVTLRTALNAAALRAQVEAILAGLVGKPVPVVLRTPAQLDLLLAAVAPLEASTPEGATQAVTLFDRGPTADAWAKLAAFDTRGDVVVPLGDAILVTYGQGQGETVLTRAKLERLLGVTATARNTNTLRKVRALVG